MSVHRYPPRAIRTDYVRTAVGLALAGGPLLLARPGTPMMTVLGGLTALFVAFGARTWIRSATRITLDDQGLSASGPRGATIRWSSLARMRLNYYSTRRDGTRGWMQMNLRDDGARLSIDSSLDGFSEIAARAARAAAERGLDLHPATRSNLALLGLDPGGSATTGGERWKTY
jgi:hypothetical protein